jgi:uncharacterized protein YceK
MSVQQSEPEALATIGKNVANASGSDSFGGEVMRGRLIVSLAAPLALLLGGCGTMVNCTSVNGPAPRTIYGGVKEDIVSGTGHLHEAFGGPCPSFSAVTHMPSTAEQVMMRSFCAGCGVCMLALDMPVTVVADTLTLPITIPATLARKKNDHPRKRKQAPSQASAPKPQQPPAQPQKMTSAAP